MKKVVACSINHTNFKYLCSNCSTFHFKNGKLRRTPILIYHTHGSSGDLSNRTENRSQHCMNKKDFENIDIIIDDTTKRE